MTWPDEKFRKKLAGEFVGDPPWFAYYQSLGIQSYSSQISSVQKKSPPQRWQENRELFSPKALGIPNLEGFLYPKFLAVLGVGDFQKHRPYPRNLNFFLLRFPIATSPGAILLLWGLAWDLRHVPAAWPISKVLDQKPEGETFLRLPWRRDVRVFFWFWVLGMFP